MSATQTISYEASIARTTLHRIIVDGVEVSIVDEIASSIQRFLR